MSLGIVFLCLCGLVGGRKAAATCSGIVDGFVYLGSGVQSIGVGYLVTHYSWQWWPIFLMPFALIGGLVAWRIWHELPAATRRYIDDVERKLVPGWRVLETADR